MASFTTATPLVASGFHRKTLAERSGAVQAAWPEVNVAALDGGLSADAATSMVENCVGVLGLPLGLGLNFVINGSPYSIPMAVEEPSVIAAASAAAKLVASGGGFSTWATRNVIAGQVQLLDVADADAGAAAVTAAKADLLATANALCASMVRRGGGAVDVVPRILRTAGEKKPMLVVHIHVDVCDAMGANLVNTVAEGVAPRVAEVVGGGCRVGLRILTNLCVERRAGAKFSLPLSKMAYRGFDGARVAAGIVEAYEFADADPYRAVTHNKGIMNGIDAAATAAGQVLSSRRRSFLCFDRGGMRHYRPRVS